MSGLSFFALHVVIWLAFCFSDTTTLTPLVGAGAPSSQFFLNAIFDYRFVDPTVQATFADAILSDGALCRILNYTAECPATDTAQPRSLDYASILNIPTPKMYQQYPDLQLYPVCAYAVVPLYNLNGSTDLVLSVQILAKIWSGRIRTWDHPDIVATNPNFTSWNVPTNQPIILVSRSDTAGVTLMLKKVMGAVDPAFNASAPNWGGLVKPISYTTTLGHISYVSRNPYTMGYAAAGDALGLVPMAKLNRSSAVVEFSEASVQYAVLEKGLSFGNNGDDPAHLTGDLHNALNPLAWPILQWSYIGVRKSTLRPGTTCATVTAMVAYWLWFWSSTDMAALGTKLGFIALPDVVREQVVAHFKKDIYCGGSLVFQEAETPVLAGYGTESASAIIDKFQQSYALVNSSVELNYTTLASDQVDVRPMLQAGGFLVSTVPPSSSSVYSLVLGSEAVVAVSTMTNLVLDGLTLAKILNGDITTWLHKDIVALNPGGLKTNGKLLNNTAQRIVLLQGPTASSTALTALMQQYYPAYTGAAIQAAERFSREALLWTGVIGSPYAFSVTPLVGTLPAELLSAAIVSNGVAVAPSLATAKGCASVVSYNPTTKAVALSHSGNSSCYPLLLTLYVSLQRQCPAPAPTARATTFLQWMFTKATLAAALDALNIVSLSAVSDAIQAANDDALFQLSCEVVPTPATPTDLVPLLLAIIIPIGVVVLLGLAACGWWFWKVTEYNRMLRKKFSNDNVAESCAEAIARFDLQAVAWLQEVREPNKIQLAFLAIIALLTEVKPFIPDQLLSRLTSKPDMKAEAGDGEADKASAASSPMVPDTQRHGQGYDSYRRDPVRAASRTSGSDAPASPLSGRRIPNPNPNRKAPGQQSIASSDGAKRVLAMRDWRRQRCTYMCARFGSTYHHQERRLLTLVEVAGRIVDIAKANGATIDAVGVDVVNVHWGVTSSSCAAIRAVQAGLEIERLRATLPEDQRDAFWVQIGIGKGVCDCGTVSSESGHRFFVVWGAEPSLAIQIATTDLPKRVLTSLLVSPAVYQEVQYTVQCMPRLYHGHLLLWEPLCVLKKKEDDEWMYELRKINDGSVPFLEVFVLAKDKKSEMELSARVAELRRSHGDTLSPQDSASLDLLLSMTTGRPCCHHSLRLEEAAALPDV